MGKFIDRLFKGVGFLIAGFLAVMILLMFVNVVMRYVFNMGFVWSEEIARICFIYLVYLGTIQAARDNRHLLIDAVLLKLPVKARKGMYAVIQLCIIWLMGIVFAGSLGLVMQNLNDKWAVTQFPTYLIYASGLLTGGGIIIISLVNLIRLFVLKESVETLIRDTDEDDAGVPGALQKAE